MSGFILGNRWLFSHYGPHRAVSAGLNLSFLSTVFPAIYFIFLWYENVELVRERGKMLSIKGRSVCAQDKEVTKQQSAQVECIKTPHCIQTHFTRQAWCTFWGSKAEIVQMLPNSPWQMSVLLAPSMMNWGLSQISFDGEKREFYFWAFRKPSIARAHLGLTNCRSPLLASSNTRSSPKFRLVWKIHLFCWWLWLNRLKRNIHYMYWDVFCLNFSFEWQP